MGCEPCRKYKELLLKRVEENRCIICGKPIAKDFVMIEHPIVKKKVKVCKYGHNIGANQQE